MNQFFTEHLPIAAPPWTRLGKKLESLCRKALYAFQLIEGVNKVAVALSGGKDSLTLLYLLKAISGRGFAPFELVAIHVGGAFSCGAGVSEPFLRGICRRLDIPLVVCTSDQREEDLECYSCSRKRRALIFEAAKRAGATTVAFGHHREDNAETVLMNLLHKGEFAGMLPKVPMHDFGVTIIRPLLLAGEGEIRAFAELYGFARIVCQCPVGQRSLRRTTKGLIDGLEKTFPQARGNLARASLLYGSDKATRKSD